MTQKRRVLSIKIALIDVDNYDKVARFPNLPLMKISAYHKARGDSVEWWMPLESYDIAYKSKVLTTTPEITFPIMADTIIEGGTAYGNSNKLPSKIEHIMPDYSIYPQFNSAYGFLTRGCPRSCSFCLVSDKEGCKSVKVANLSEFWCGQKHITLLDPNILACSEHLELLQQLVDSKSWIDFSQGLDIRLITPENVALIKQLKIKMLHFAWDNPREDLVPQFVKFKEWSGITNYRKLSVYVLTNYGSSHEEDLYRIYTLRELGYWAYVMLYDKANAPLQTRRLQRWVNNRIIFQTVKDFADYEKSYKKGGF